jgi:hypothetical protein
MFERGMVTTKYPMQYVKVDLKELSSIADYLNKIDPKNRAKICAEGLMTVSDVNEEGCSYIVDRENQYIVLMGWRVFDVLDEEDFFELYEITKSTI